MVNIWNATLGWNELILFRLTYLCIENIASNWLVQICSTVVTFNFYDFITDSVYSLPNHLLVLLPLRTVFYKFNGGRSYASLIIMHVLFVDIFIICLPSEHYEWRRDLKTYKHLRKCNIYSETSSPRFKPSNKKIPRASTTCFHSTLSVTPLWNKIVT